MPATIPLDDLIAALDSYIDPFHIPDFAPTGLQVRGRPEVARVALGVSANCALFEAATGWGADLVVTHHGLFWESDDPEHDPARRIDDGRAAFLRARGMSLAAYHLPLDAHPEVGNNAEIARHLGLQIEGFDLGELPGVEAKIGLTARAEPPLTHGELLERAGRVFGQPPHLIPAGPELIRTIGIVSGGGTRDIYDAIAKGRDAFLTGEGREWVPALAREAGITFLAVGHYASEVFGVQAVGRWLNDRFGVATQFFPEPNPF